MNAVNVKIDGQPITMNFGLLAFRLYTEHHNISLAELGPHMEKGSALALADMMFFAYQAHCQLQGKELAFNIYQATEWVEEIEEKQLEKVQNAMMDVRIMGKSINDNAPEQKKTRAKS